MPTRKDIRRTIHKSKEPFACQRSHTYVEFFYKYAFLIGKCDAHFFLFARKKYRYKFGCNHRLDNITITYDYARSIDQSIDRSRERESESAQERERVRERVREREREREQETEGDCDHARATMRNTERTCTQKFKR